jgi:hypothetical protein
MNHDLLLAISDIRLIQTIRGLEAWGGAEVKEAVVLLQAALVIVRAAREPVC